MAEKVSIVGTTSWGTTLAIILSKSGADVILWARTEEEANVLESARENQIRLPGVPFPPTMHITNSLKDTVTNSDVIVLAVPSQSLRENVRALLPHLDPNSIILSATKGLEKYTANRMSQVLEDELPQTFHSRITVLSGPNLSKEIAQGMPASTVISSRDEDAAVRAQHIFMSPALRVYTNTDMIGVELGGSLKNIIAIGAGISDGLGYGNNGKAAFITRGLVEITRLGVAAGANPLTFAGLTGLGDLITTCYSQFSRNRYVGEQLALGNSLEKILSSMQNVAEGVDTTVGALALASRLNVDMPLTQAIYTILFEGVNPRDAVIELMNRAPRSEWLGIHD